MQLKRAVGIGHQRMKEWILFVGILLNFVALIYVVVGQAVRAQNETFKAANIVATSSLTTSTGATEAFGGDLDMGSHRINNALSFDATHSGVVPASGGGTSTFLRADGSWATPAGGAGNGLFGAVLSAVPTTTSTGLTTWLNQPSGATVTNSAQGVAVYQPSTSGARTFAVISKAAPATPYTITALVALNGFWANADTGATAQSCFGWSDGTKLQVLGLFGLNTNPAGTPSLSVEGFTSFTSATATSFNQLANGSLLAWMRISDDGTNISFYASVDGEHFVLLYTIAKASGYLANYNTVVFAEDSPNRDSYGEILSWVQN